MPTSCNAKKRWYSLRAKSKKMEKEYCSLEEFLLFWGKEHKCEYCQTHQKNLTESLHIDRVDPMLGYSIENCVFACRMCNITKSNIFTYEEMKEIGIKYIKPKHESSLKRRFKEIIKFQRSVKNSIKV